MLVKALLLVVFVVCTVKADVTIYKEALKNCIDKNETFITLVASLHINNITAPIIAAAEKDLQVIKDSLYSTNKNTSDLCTKLASSIKTTSTSRLTTKCTGSNIIFRAATETGALLLEKVKSNISDLGTVLWKLIRHVKEEFSMEESPSFNGVVEKVVLDIGRVLLVLYKLDKADLCPTMAGYITEIKKFHRKIGVDVAWCVRRQKNYIVDELEAAKTRMDRKCAGGKGLEVTTRKVEVVTFEEEDKEEEHPDESGDSEVTTRKVEVVTSTNEGEHVKGGEDLEVTTRKVEVVTFKEEGNEGKHVNGGEVTTKEVVVNEGKPVDGGEDLEVTTRKDEVVTFKEEGNEGKHVNGGEVTTREVVVNEGKPVDGGEDLEVTTRKVEVVTSTNEGEHVNGGEVTTRKVEVNEEKKVNATDI